MTNIVAEARGPLLVLGAAGSGKTTLLVEAVAERIQRRESPALVFTASRQAASEVRDRIVRRAGCTTLAPAVMTIHAFCRALVGRWGDEADAPWALLAAPAQEFRIRELLRGRRERWPADVRAAVGTRGFAAQVRAAIARARQLGWDPDDVRRAGEVAREPVWEALGGFFAEYLDVLDAEGALDYAELVHRSRILLGRPDVLASVHAQYGAVYIDDWCELDPAQMAVVRSLVPTGAPVVALADPDTAIYRFRGAHPRAVAEFERLFSDAGAAPGLTVLETAWRRSPELVDALSRVAGRLSVPGVPATVVQAYRGVTAAGRGEVRVRTYPDEASQARHVASHLRAAHLNDGMPWGDMAILVRSGRAQIPAFVRALTDAGVPVEVAGDEIGLADEAAVRPLLLALDVAARGGGADPDEAERLVLSGWGGFDAVRLRALGRALRRSTSETVAPSTAGLVAEALSGVRPVPEGFSELTALRDALAEATRLVAAGARPEEALWALWSGTSWPGRLRAEALGVSEGAARAHHDLDVMVALFTLAQESVAPGGADGVRWFAAEVAQQQIPADGQREAAVRGRGVRVLTAHRAGGHQWPLTVVAGVQEGVWPDARRRGAILDPERLTSSGLGEGVVTRELVAAERRLFLLACSRSCGSLLVTAVAGEEGEEQRPSRFLTELGIRREHVAEAPPGRNTLRSLIAEMRAHAEDASLPPALRRAAATRLAGLADASDDRGRPLAPDASPQRWWGVAEPTSTVALPADAAITLSPSQVEGLLTCPRRHFLGRRVRAESPRGEAQLVGTVVHAIVERLAGGEVTAEAIPALLDEAWSRIPFGAPWQALAERAEAEASLRRYLNWQAGHDFGEVLEVEAGFSIPIDVAGGPVTLVGTIDRLERSTSGGLRVVDFKTGRRAPTVAEGRASIQVGIYQLAVQAGAFAKEAPGAGTEGGALVYLRLGDKNDWPKELHQPSLSECPYLGDDPSELAHPTWVHARVAEARAIVAAGRYDARPGKHCEGCPVRSSCPVTSGQVV